MSEITDSIKRKEFKIAKIFRKLNVNWINIDKLKNSEEISKGFFNINTFEDLEIIKKI